MKLCRKCSTEKSIDDFHKNKGSKDGLTSVCKPCAIEKARKWYAENKEYATLAMGEYRDANKEKEIERARQWAIKNREKSQAIKAAWKKRNPECGRSYQKRKVANDLLFKLKIDMRRRLWSVLAGRGWKKSRRSEEIFGCTYEFLMEYLTSKFKEGMSWENRSEWHIDHIVPLASAKTAEEMCALAHYTNLQPLWAAENWAKGGRDTYEDLV